MNGEKYQKVYHIQNLNKEREERKNRAEKIYIFEVTMTKIFF